MHIYTFWTNAYYLIRQVYSLTAHHSPLNSYGFLFDQEDKERIVNDDGVVITARHYFTLPWDARATDGSTWPEGGAMLIKLGEYDYLLAGSGVVLDFKTKGEKAVEERKQLGEDGFALGNDDSTSQDSSPRGTQRKREKYERLGLLSVDEVSIDEDGHMHYLRRHNGDQTHQGRHARIAMGDWKTLYIRLYKYE